MAVGVSIFLIAAGAVLAFALNMSVSGIDLNLVGWILMGAGVLGLLFDLLVFMPRRRREVVWSRGPQGEPVED